MQLAITKTDYSIVADEIRHLRELKQNALSENVECEGRMQRISEMTEFLNDQTFELQIHDDHLTHKLIERVTVFDNKLTVEFESCVESNNRDINRFIMSNNAKNAFIMGNAHI